MTQVNASHHAFYEYEPEIAEHRIEMRLLDVNLAARYQLNSVWGVEVAAPVRVVEVDASYFGHDGERLANDISDIHHRDERFVGMGDVQMMGTVQFPSVLAGWNTNLSLRLGFSLPSAGVEPNPFELGEVGKRHQHIFFGSGTVDPIVGVSFRTAFQGFDLMGWTLGKTAVSSNEYGYQAPTAVSGALGIKGGFGLESIEFVLQQELLHEEPAQWERADGTMDSALNSGRTELIASLGVFWKATRNLNAYALAKVPYYRRVREGTLKIPGYVSVGFQIQLPLGDPESSTEFGEDGPVYELAERESFLPWGYAEKGSSKRS